MRLGAAGFRLVPPKVPDLAKHVRKRHRGPSQEDFTATFLERIGELFDDPLH